MAFLLVKAVTGGIGLAAEAIATRKATKLSKQASNNTRDIDIDEQCDSEISSTVPSSSNLENYDSLPSYDAAASNSQEAQQTEQTIQGNLMIEEEDYDSDSSTLSQPRRLSRGSLDAESIQSGDEKRLLEEIDEDSDEEIWELDDAQHVIMVENANAPPSYEETVSSVDEVINTFNATHLNEKSTAILSTVSPVRSISSSQPALVPSPVTGRLPCPIILPQRRPGSLNRGFVRAYSPILMQAGIDQATFMDFLAAFDRAIQISPVFDVLNIASTITGLSPSPSPQVVSLVLNVALSASKSVYGKASHFLQSMNEKLFKPKGLVCFIMNYKPESDQAIQSWNLGRDGGPIGGFVRHQIRSRWSSEKNNTPPGELELPEAAPLVFPDIDTLPEAQKHKAGFLNDYLDRRAQAHYIARNPDSRLAVAPAPQFASRFSDPNHPVNSGSLVALVTGGRIVFGSKRDRMNLRREYSSEWRIERATSYEPDINRDLSNEFKSRRSRSKFERKLEKKKAELGRKWEHKRSEFDRKLDKKLGRKAGKQPEKLSRRDESLSYSQDSGNGIYDYPENGPYRENSLGARRRRHGPVGGLIGLAGAVVTAAQQSHKQQKLEQQQSEQQQEVMSRGISHEALQEYREDSSLQPPSYQQPAQAGQMQRGDEKFISPPDHLHPAYAQPPLPRTSSFSSLQPVCSTAPGAEINSGTVASSSKSSSHPLRQYVQRSPDSAEKSRQRKRGPSRLIRQNVLYLMICNMPTEEEIENAKQLSPCLALQATQSITSASSASVDLLPSRSATSSAPPALVSRESSNSNRGIARASVEYGVIYPDCLENEAIIQRTQ